VGALGSAVVIGRHTPIRERIYQVLLSYPRREWTIRDLAAASGDGVSISSARDAVYMLTAAAAMAAVPATRAVTVRLTADGRDQIQSIVDGWQSLRGTRIPHQLTASAPDVDLVNAERSPAERDGRPGGPVTHSYACVYSLVMQPPEQLRLCLKVRPGADGLHVEVTGDLDVSTADELVRAITTDLPQRDPTLFLDLAGVGFCGSAGVSALIELRRHQQDRGNRLRLANVTDQVRRVLHITGVLPSMSVLAQQPAGSNAGLVRG
jgi:anti-sigma B factor antagonist